MVAVISVFSNVCSTPFGIRGRITRHLAPGALTLAVLNAFRHQRKDHRRMRARSSRACWCSTPFGIRGRITRRVHDQGRRHPVLNAFRHQRKDHRQDRAGRDVYEDVLNAFRHQRKDHVIGNALTSSGQVCSTPFGIRGRITHPHLDREQHRFAGAQRLSASEEGSHVCLIASAFSGLCSTPFGIRGRITSPASTRLGRKTVLNAFRHQRKDHLAGESWFSEVASAQRLSASEEGSLAGHSPGE